MLSFRIYWASLWSSGSVLDYRSLPPMFESPRGHIWRWFHLQLFFITFGGRSGHLAYHVHKSGCKNSIIQNLLMYILKALIPVIRTTQRHDLFEMLGHNHCFCYLFYNTFTIFYLGIQMVQWLKDCPCKPPGSGFESDLIPISGICFLRLMPLSDMSQVWPAVRLNHSTQQQQFFI